MNLMTLKNLVEKYQFLTYSSLQWHMFHRETNGLAQAVIKIGRRVYVDEEAFLAWLESKREG